MNIMKSYNRTGFINFFILKSGKDEKLVILFLIQGLLIID